MHLPQAQHGMLRAMPLRTARAKHFAPKHCCKCCVCCHIVHMLVVAVKPDRRVVLLNKLCVVCCAAGSTGGPRLATCTGPLPDWVVTGPPCSE
jgi:hypothetical protein